MTLLFLNVVIIASLKNESICKLINKIPGSRLLVSSLPGSASRTQASRCQQALLMPCMVNLISNDTHLVFCMSQFICTKAPYCIVGLVSLSGPEPIN